MSKRFEWHFAKEDIRIANKYMKVYSISLIFREMQIRLPIKYYYIPIRMAIIKTKENKQANKTIANIECRGEHRPTETFMHCRWGCQMVETLRKTAWQFLQKWRNPTARYFRWNKIYSRTKPWMYCSYLPKSGNNLMYFSWGTDKPWYIIIN